MVGNLPSVTAAPARTPASPESRSELVGASQTASSGKVLAPSGESLPAPPPPPPRPVVDVAAAAERLNELMSNRQRMLRFRVDQGSGRTVIIVINEATNEVIRQIPPEELLQLQQNLEQLGSMISTRI
jgi:flagellar protein FlaG